MTDQPSTQQGTRQDHQPAERNGHTHRIKRRLTSISWLARAAAVGLSSLSIVFVVLFMFVLETGGDLTLMTRPLPMRIALVVPSLIGITTLATTVGAVLAWRYRYWSLVARIHQTILSLLGIAFTWQLSRLGFLIG